MKDEYRHTLKATFIMSFAQITGALSSIIRAKIIAIIMGPIGIGLNSIFQITINTAAQINSLGINQSGVRDISYAHNTDIKKYQQTINAFYTLICYTAFAGLILFALVAPLLNYSSFGSSKTYLPSFYILAFGLFFFTLSNGNITLLQGSQKLLPLAKSSITGYLSSLLIGIPLYIFAKEKGIVIAIVIGYALTYLANSYFVRKSGIKPHMIKLNQAILLSKPILKLGVIIMISSFIINGYSYLTNVLIRLWGGLEDVGLYQSAFALTSQNMAIISAALVADYYPRLSVVRDNRTQFNTTVSQQGEILLIAITFISILLIIFAPIVIKILLSESFMTITPLVRAMSFAFIFRSTWSVLAYIALAKGDRKVYLWYDAVLGNGGYFIINMGAYYYGGLEALGFSCIIGSAFVALLLLIVYSRKYHFAFSNSYYKLFFICFLLISLFGALTFIKSSVIFIITSIVLCIPTSIFLFKALNNRVNLKEYIIQKRKHL